jgi:AIPR protein
LSVCGVEVGVAMLTRTVFIESVGRYSRIFSVTPPTTNSQSAVKARDLRSNDKRVLAIKKTFELKYPSGFFITKRGQIAPPEKNKDQVVELSNFAKNLIAWHSQRPNLSYGETKVFEYFETLFKDKDYPPENVLVLNAWMNEVMKAWVPANPLT